MSSTDVAAAAPSASGNSPVALPGEGPQPSGRYLSLRFRLLALVVLVLLPWLALVLYTQAEERKAATANVNRDAMRLVHFIASNQATQMEAARELLAAFARMPQIRSGERAACSRFLADMLAAYSLYVNIGVAERDGGVVCSAVTLRTPVNISDRPYFRKAMETRRFAVGDYQIGRITGQPSINYAHPVLDDAGNAHAVVFAAQDLKWLTRALGDVALPGGSVLLLTDGLGTVLARLPADDTRIGKQVVEQPVLASLSGRNEGSVLEADDEQGVRRLWAHAPVMTGINLNATIGVPASIAFGDIDRRFARDLAALAVVTAIALAVAWFGCKFILRQVDALVAATGRLAAGDMEARAPSAGRRSELDLLAHAFNGMVAALQARERELRAAEQRTRTAEVELAVTRAHMDIAREIQQSLLPQGSLTVGGMRFAGRCIPAVGVGGDYFAYLPSGHDRIDSFVGDVSGHGVGAALLMAEARTTFMAERLIAPGAGGILTKLNDLLHDDLDRAGLFMTACCATFDASTRKLTYANAGHPPALLLRANESKCAAISAYGLVLGFEKDAGYAEVRLEVDEDDIVVFYTDGVTEARNEAGEAFGIARLERAIVSHRHEDPEVIIPGVFDALDRFTGARQHEDDLTVVVMKQATVTSA
jgi:serine phosphatase RsbU (regulator of sigma subunit)